MDRREGIERMNPLNNSLYGNYRQRKFTQIWENVEAFLNDYTESGIPQLISETSATTLYYLLYARYGNSTIASSDENQFKYKVFTYIFMYGPTWEKRLEIQKAIRELDIEEIKKGSTAIYNKALNPETPPNTQTLEEIEMINEQNVNKYKRSTAEAYALLIGLLQTDVTAYFLDRFRDLFLKIVEPELPLWYVTDLVEQGEEEDE